MGGEEKEGKEEGGGGGGRGVVEKKGFLSGVEERFPGSQAAD